MEQLVEAVIEWREARKAFWRVPAVGEKQRFPMDIWTRLGRAEDRLMELANKLEEI